MSDAQVNKAVPLQPTADAIREQLARILECQHAPLGERSRKFLNYIVTETLAGRSSRIKAYTVAADVLGRTNFDPQNDPVVRIEAGRLRRDLERFYLLAGPDEPVIITIPKGSYVPAFKQSAIATGDRGGAEDTFSNRASANVFSQAPLSVPRLGGRAGSWLAAGLTAVALSVIAYMLHDRVSNPQKIAVNAMRPTIAVKRFDSIGHDRPDISEGLTDLVVENLVKFNELQVFEGSAISLDQRARGEGPRYALEGSIRHDGDRLRLAARLVRASDGTVIWADSYDAYSGTENLFEIEMALANEIATAVGQPFGVLFESDVKPNGPGGWEAYDCSLAYYSYRRVMTVEALAAAQLCLKSVIAKSSDSTSLALLSLTDLDEFRFAYKFGNKPNPAKLDTASALAEHAIDLNPKNARALQAFMLTRFFRDDIKAALEAGEAALQINPNDTEVAGEYGLRLSFSGNWQTGCDLVSKAISKNAGPPGYYEVGMALCAIMRDDYAAAEIWSRTSDLNYNPMHRMVLASILGAAGKIDQAKREVEWLNANAPVLMSNLEQELGKRLARPEDRERVFAGLRAAGVIIGVKPAAAGD